MLPPKYGRQTLGVFDSRAEAEAALQAALTDHRRGVDVQPTSLTVRELMARFFEEGVADLSVTTLHRYQELWSIHGAPLANYTIADLRKRHVNGLYTALQREPRGKRKPLNPRTVLHLHRVLHRAFQWALDDAEIITSNIFRKVKRPPDKEPQTRALSFDEGRAFFAAARGSKFEAFFHLAILTGCRRGELVAAKWNAIDLDAGAFDVRKSLAATRAKKAERDGGASPVILKPPKSGKSRRVPLDADAVAVLRRVKARQARQQLAAAPGTYQDQGHVFSDARGRPFKLDAPTKAFREIADAADLPKELTLHSLRHSFASWALGNGAAIAAVQLCLGHSKPSTTLNLYTDALSGGQEKAVAAVSNVLQRVQAKGERAAG